jgi:hypothetical protein
MHTYLIGKSGTGKSTFLQHHILKNEGGFCLLDPHGDLAETIADTLDCIYWETSDTEHVVGLNVLAHVPEDQKHLVAAQVVSSFKAIWGESWGPRLEWILYNAVRLLIDNNGSLLDIPKLLTDGSYRGRCLTHASYRAFWEGEFEEWDDRYRNEAIGPVLNKIGQFVANPVLSGILRRSTIYLTRIMNRGELKDRRLVVNLAKGKLGDQPSHLLGALLVSAIAQAAEQRATIPFEERVPFTLYADEFQNFATDSFASILSEARKYRLNVVLAHQYLGQLPELLRQAVFGNVGIFGAFRVSAEDAEPLAKEFNLHAADTMQHGFNSDACELGLHTPRVLTATPPHHLWLREELNISLQSTAPPVLRKNKLKSNRSRTRARYTRRVRRPGSNMRDS